MQAKGDLEARSAPGLTCRAILSIKLVQIPGQVTVDYQIRVDFYDLLVFSESYSFSLSGTSYRKRSVRWGKHPLL